MKRLLVRSCVLAGLFCLTLVGCSGGSGAALSGTVTLDGAPLPDAEVIFEPYDRETGKGGDTVRTNNEGKFTVESSSKKAGLKPGTKYKVYISKWVDKKGLPPNPPEEAEQLRAAGMLRNMVPYKYSNKEEAPVLTVEVKSGKNEPVTFALTK